MSDIDRLLAKVPRPAARGSWLSRLPEATQQELERFFAYLVKRERLGTNTARSYKSWAAKALVSGKVDDANVAAAVEALRRYRSASPGKQR
jgi:hypothetical protein